MKYEITITNTSENDILDVLAFKGWGLTKPNRWFFNKPSENKDLIYSSEVPPDNIIRYQNLDSVHINYKDNAALNYSCFHIISMEANGSITFSPITPRMIDEDTNPTKIVFENRKVFKGWFENVLLNKITAKSTVSIEVELS